jgi:hypothetical protein
VEDHHLIVSLGDLPAEEVEFDAAFLQFAVFLLQ